MNKNIYCSFCGKEITSLATVGNNAAICSDCANLAVQYYNENSKEVKLKHFYKAICRTKSVYEDAKVKEIARFKEIFKDIIIEENVDLNDM